MQPYEYTAEICCAVSVKIKGFGNKFPPNLNHRIHWAQRARLNKMWRARVYLAIGADRPKFPLNKTHVIFTKISTKACDFDNLVTSMKPIADGLKDAGVIIDDSVEYFSAEYKFEKCKRGDEKLRIEIKEIL